MVKDVCIWYANQNWYKSIALGDYHCIYNKRSGDSHILNFFAFALLRILTESPMKIDHRLQQILAVELDLLTDDIPIGLIESTIHELDDFALLAARDSDETS